MSESDQKIDAMYLNGLTAFKASLRDAIWTSVQSTGFDAGPRRYWSSVLLVRLCSIGQSMLRLCPDLLEPDPVLHWDFASVGSIARSLFECGMFFRYFSTKVGEDEWSARLNLMRLNDCTERIRLFIAMGNEEEAKSFEVHLIDLRKRLTDNPYFQALDPKTQKTLFQGYRAGFYRLNELVEQYIPDKRIWYIYQLFSSHTHSSPLSFYRTREQRRTGVENQVDKSSLPAVGGSIVPETCAAP